MGDIFELSPISRNLGSTINLLLRITDCLIEPICIPDIAADNSQLLDFNLQSPVTLTHDNKEGLLVDYFM